MKPIEFVSDSESSTWKLGEAIGKNLVSGTVIFLNGTLGAGKTRLVQAIAAGLDIDPANVQSPTFTMMTPHSGRLTLVHIDAYRIKDLDEAEQLGATDWLENGSVLAIEWADRIGETLPPPDLRIDMEHIDETKRGIKLSSPTKLGQQLMEPLIEKLD